MTSQITNTVHGPLFWFFGQLFWALARSWLAGKSSNPSPKVDESYIFGILKNNFVIEQSYSEGV